MPIPGLFKKMSRQLLTNFSEQDNANPNLNLFSYRSCKMAI